MILRDYKYLDTDRLQDYLSSLDPGVIEEFTETFKDTTDTEAGGGLKVAITGSGGEAGGKRRSGEETVRERTVKISAKNMFNRIYEELDKDDDAIKVFDEDEPIDFKGLKKREVVEISRRFSPSPINEMIDSILRLLEVMENFGFTEELGDPETQQAVRAMAMIFQGDPGEEDVPMVSRGNGDSTAVVFLAKSRFLLANGGEFEGDMTLFGRVQKKIPQAEVLDLFDFIKLPKGLRAGTGDTSFKDELYALFESWPKELGGPIDRNSTLIRGPVLVVTPVAVYV